jgi:dTDP-4-amino-4,6-dideoxygalactose transaminase
LPDQKSCGAVQGGKLVAGPAQCQSNYWLQTLLLDTTHADQCDTVLKATNDAGFVTRPTWILMNELAPFKDCQRMYLNIAQSLTQRLINMPSSSGLVSVAP